MPRSAGVFVLRHLGDAVRTGLRYAEVEDHRPSADRSADETPQAPPLVLPWTPKWDVPACGGSGGFGKSAASWLGAPHRAEWKRIIRRRPA
jgi:hypothetical protein